ncbi:hypothetical protein VST7929_02552 [Vibrio stylophorae]|uniref:Flagellar protein MotX n=1 Tax=Vibrio stylophorae TaxID=659351 RepID=A0ABN8DX37_9VIBR|nr:tetratricopeptide repeat protein [Vibrio stylophorae]CAH0534607.1 hypothetical protein VST7929_02552 [Vibrio stylophorae]
MKLRTLIFAMLFSTTAHALTEVGPAVEIYSEDQLLRQFATNAHLKQVKADDCQLVQDIQARALRVDYPAYQFLWGDMLTWGVCVDRDVEQGLYYIELAAQQGLPDALEQLGRYYAHGTLVQKDRERAIPYLREAASLGSVKARILLAQLLLDDVGSPLDYEDAYRWLYHTVTDDRKTHRQIAMLRNGLERRMPANIVARAKKRDTYW